jgi:hypothetical protein
MENTKDEVICPVCGTKNLPERTTCQNCGAKLGAGQAAVPHASEGAVVSLADSLQMLMETARDHERSGNLQGALSTYRRAKAFGEAHQGDDSSIKMMVQMLDTLIQRTEEMLKKGPSTPPAAAARAAGSAASPLDRAVATPANWQAEQYQGGAAPKKGSTNALRWILAVGVLAVLCILLAAGGTLAFFGTKGQGPLAMLATDTFTPTKTPTPSNTPTPSATFTPSATPVPKTLSTIFSGGNGAGGNMFDVSALHTITITGFDLNVDSYETETIEIWYIPGGYSGNEYSSSGWTHLDSLSVRGKGSGNRTHVNITTLTIPAGQTYGLYIYLVTSGNGNLDYTDGSNVYSNSDLRIISGTGNSANFGDVYQPRIWNGVIYYIPGN